jgi:hypothetical protein
MPSQTSTTNPTGLIEIARKHIEISRFEVAGKRKFQFLKLDLATYDLKGDDEIVVIARAATTSRRYALGSVACWSAAAYELEGLDTSHAPRFRVLIRRGDAAKLIASAENLRCVGDGDVESLLPIVSTDLGQRLWRLAIDDDGAILQCNKDVFPNGESAQGYAPFCALVLPEALRGVLAHIAKDPTILGSDETGWGDWGVWMRQLGIEVPPPADEDLRPGWVEESTAIFCESFQFATDLQKALQAGEHV